MSIRATRRPVGRPTNGTQAVLLQKTMTISIVGYSKKLLDSVAHAIHSMGHTPDTVGGRFKRTVHITTLSSTDAIKIFDGKVEEADTIL